MRLIDASALWSDIQMLPHNGDMISSEEVEQVIAGTKTIDAVPVVRCKDCKYFFYNSLCNKHSRPGSYLTEYEFCMPPNGFCSYGKRKEGST